MSLQSQTTDSVFLKYWTPNGGNILSTHIQQIPNQQNSSSNGPPITLRTTQIRGVQQGDGDQSCGYYGIFFISKLTQIFNKLSSQTTNKFEQTQIIDSIHRIMKDISTKNAFNQFKTDIINELLTECNKRNTNCYPWLKAHINSGVLERVYLQFLQNNYFRKNRLQMLHNDNDNDNDQKQQNDYPIRYSNSIASKYNFRYLYDSINLMEFSESSLKTNHLPLTTIDNLEYFFNHKFLNKIENYKIFLIGSAIHYAVCALYRNNITNYIDIIYIDPQNNNILYKNKNDLINQIINPMKFKSWLKVGWKLKDMRQLAMDSFRGIQFAVTNLITNTIINIYSNDYHTYFIRNCLININISNGFIAGFNNHVLAPMVRHISVNDNTSDDNDDNNTDDNNNDNVGWFVGVNQDFDLKNNDDDDINTDNNDKMNVNLWKKDCAFVMNVISQKLNDIQAAIKNKNNINNDAIKKHILDIQTCSAFAKIWISTYYPSAVIDSNIVNVVNKLENDAYIPKIVLQLLNTWSSLMMVFANANNRKLAQIEDDKFWKRLASTLLVVQIVSQTDPALTKL